MDESDSSSSSIEHVLNKYRNERKLNLALPKQSNSEYTNTLDNINAASTSTASALIEVCSSSSSFSSSKITKTKKTKSVSKKKEIGRKKNPKNGRDPPKSKRNYEKLTDKELDSIGSRVRFYHETGIVLSDDDDNIKFCKNKRKQKSTLVRLEQIPGTRFGTGAIGTTRSNYNPEPCSCCNIRKDQCRLLNLMMNPYHDITASMSEEMRNELKRKEERRFLYEQRELLRHPEFLASVNNSQDIPTPELTPSKRQWIERFMDTMSPERFDYKKAQHSKIVNGVAHNRVSEIKPPTNTSNPNDILQRVDFKKNDEPKFTQCCLDDWLAQENTSTPSKNYFKISAASTPYFNNEHVDNAVENDAGVGDGISANAETLENIAEGSPIVSLDDTKFDRSNITIRTPRRSHLRQFGPSTSRAQPVLTEAKENEIMDFVDLIVAPEMDTITQQANEICNRITETQNIFLSTLNDVLTIDDDFDHDNSVQIIDLSDYDVNDSSVEIIAAEFPNNRNSVRIPPPSRRSRSNRGQKRGASNSSGRNKKKQSNSEAIAPVISQQESTTLAEASSNKLSASRDCPICLESLCDKEISATTCGHVFCTSCITAAVRAQRACPNCRTKLTLKKIHPLFL